MKKLFFIIVVLLTCGACCFCDDFSDYTDIIFTREDNYNESYIWERCNPETKDVLVMVLKRISGDDYDMYLILTDDREGLEDIIATMVLSVERENKKYRYSTNYYEWVTKNKKLFIEVENKNILIENAVSSVNMLIYKK